jgi:prophage maintenance system killer protein
MTANLVYYHHPDDDQFSLDFVNSDREAIDGRLESYDERTETRVRSYDLDEVVYVIYAKTNEVDDTEKIEYDFDVAFAEMDPNTRVIVREILEVFTGIQEEKQDEEGVPLDAYKNIELERFPAALDHVDWVKTVPETGGQLASNLVLCHALPNANHRTAFGILEAYLKAVDSSFELPSMVTDDYEWQAWVDEYIVDSKRLLTVRRNVGPFGYLAEYGCGTVRRKGGIDVPLAEYDLEMHRREAFVEYANQHEQRTTTFVETILRETNSEGLLEASSLRKETFAECLRRLD